MEHKMDTALDSAVADKAQIKEILEKVISGENGAEMASYYATEAILWDVLPPETRGREAIGKFFDTIMVDQEHLKGEIRRLHIEVEHTLATAYSIQHFTWVSKATGQPGEILFRQSDMLRKSKDRWEIIHQHISVPIDVKTGQAMWKFECKATRQLPAPTLHATGSSALLSL